MRWIAGLSLCVALSAAPLHSADLEPLWARYNRGELAPVVEAARAELTKSPDDADLHLLLGRALVGLRRYEEARAPLERTLALDTDHTWRSAWALTFLGRVEYAGGRTAASREALLKAIALNATANATKDARQLVLAFGFDESLEKWSVHRSEHFVFHFAPSLEKARFEAYAAEHERAFETIVTFFGAGPPKKIDFFVWDDGETERTHAKLGFAIPEFCVVHAHAKQTVGHEMTHVISWWAGHPAVETGLISEGTAVCFDQNGGGAVERARAALQRAGGPPVSVERLWSNWREIPGDVSYPVAGAFVRHLIVAGGRERFLQLLRDQSLAGARAVYGADLQKLAASFEESLASPTKDGNP